MAGNEGMERIDPSSPVYQEVMDAPNEPNALRARRSLGLDEGLAEVSAIEDFQLFAQQAGYDGLPEPKPEYPGAVHATSALLDRATNSSAERAELLATAIDQPVMMRWDTIANSIVQNELGDAVPSESAHQQAARAHLINEMAVPEWEGIQFRERGGPLVAGRTNEALDTAVSQIREHYQNNPDEPYPAGTPNPAAEVATEVGQQDERQRAVTNPDRIHNLADLPTPDAATRVPDAQAPGVDRGAEPPADSDRTEAVRPAPSDRIEAGQGTPAAQVEGTHPGNAQPTSSGHANASQSAAAQHGDPMRLLGNQAPAAHATRTAPDLGNGARGAGAPAGPAVDCPSPTRTPTPERGGRD